MQAQVEQESYFCQKCERFFHYSEKCSCPSRDSWLPEEPKLRINWIYGYPDPPILHGRKIDTLRNLATHKISGARFEAKSTLLGLLEYKYVTNDAIGFDMYCAKSNETLAQLECRKLKDRIVLVHDDSVKLKCDYNTIEISRLDPSRATPGQLFVTVGAFYPSEEAKYHALLKFTQSLDSRAENGWNNVGVMAIREAQEYINSKALTNQTRTQKQAAEDFVNFHNSAYHFGMSVITDNQRDMEVSKNIRELNTFAYYKSLGAMEIPKKIQWIGSQYYANFDLDDLRKLKKNQFLIITDRNSVGIGSFDLPYWYYHRGEGLVKKYNIIVTDKNDRELDTKIRRENEDALRARSNAGRKKITSSNMRETIKELFDKGAGISAIYQELVKQGYKGSERTIRNEINEIQREEIMDK